MTRNRAVALIKWTSPAECYKEVPIEGTAFFSFEFVIPSSEFVIRNEVRDLLWVA